MAPGHDAPQPKARADSGRKETAERFILQKFLGAGGLNEVYEALDLVRLEMNDIQPKVALKRLRPEIREQAPARLSLSQEFVKIRSLSHPGIIRVYDLHFFENELCMTMELITGPTLKQKLRSGPALSSSSDIEIAAKIFSALDYIHKRGLIHGDLKPGNIFLKGGSPVIFDFNSSAAIAVFGQVAENPVQGLVDALRLDTQTTLYSSPERLRGQSPCPADDVFSAAATVYEFLSGRHPFNRRSPLTAEEENIIPRKLPSLSNRRWVYLKAALDLKAARRPAASELADVFGSTLNLTLLKKDVGYFLGYLKNTRIQKKVK